MSSAVCAGCHKTLSGSGNALLLCCRCPDKYHYACMNLTQKDFDNLDTEFKESWVCPCCRCKQPKPRDNTNTPVRAVGATPPVRPTESVPSPLYDNVTLRSKPRTSGSCACLSADALREIIREELDRKFNSEIASIHSRIDKLEDCLAVSNSERDTIKAENESQKALIFNLQKEKEDLRTTTSDLKHRLRQLEQLSRANNLELQCVPEHSNENLLTTVQQLGNTIKCPLTDSDLEYCSRIARLNTTSPRPRSILVRFASRRLRDTFLAGVIKYNKNNPREKLNTSHLGYGGSKKTPVFVSEHLTAEAKALHAAARLKAKELHYRFVWTRDGKVLMRKSEDTRFILVKDLSVLSSLK